jgi:putative hemolysin
LHLPRLTEEDLRGAQTVGGFVMYHIGSVPVEGRHIEWHGLRIEMVDIDGKCVDKVLVTRL